MNAHPQDNLHQPRQRTSHLHLISPHSLQFPHHDMAPIRFAILKRNQCINNNKDAISVNNLPQGFYNHHLKTKNFSIFTSLRRLKYLLDNFALDDVS